jgi:iron complex outermembrane receptor protein
VTSNNNANLWNLDMHSKKNGSTGKRSGLHYRNAALLGCTALIAFSPVTSLAQDADSSGSNTVLQTITIDGAGADDDSKSIVATKTTSGGKIATDIMNTPASVSVITSKEIQQRGAQNVEEVLQYTAGVTTDFYGSDDRFDYFKVRGFDAYMYRDGLLIGRPFGGLREEPFAYERVEVLKGANSATFGVSDPGGAVNYMTKRPKNERFGEAYVTGGSYDRAETGIDFGDNITEDDTLSYRITGKVKNAKAEFDFSNDDEKFFMGGLTWRPTDVTSLTVVYDHLNTDGVPGSGGHPVGTDFSRSRFFGEPDFNYRGVNRNSLSVMFDHDFGSGLSFSTNARYSKANTDFGYAYIASTPTNGSTTAKRSFFADDSSDENFIVDSRLQYEANFDAVESTTLFGVEYNNLSSDGQINFGDAPGIDWTNPIYSGAPTSVPLGEITRNRQYTTAIYAQQDLTFSEKLIATVALRNDWLDLKQHSTSYWTGSEVVSNDEDRVSELTKRFGVTYRFTDAFAAYASYAESVAPPTVGVQPERGDQIELGVKYQPTDFPGLFTAAIYDLTKSNITVTNPVTNLPSTIGEVRVRGLDLEAKTEVTNNFSLTAAYSYLKSEITENGTGGNIGNELQFVPNHSASLWGNYTLEGNDTIGDMTFGLGARYIGSYYFDDANTQKTGNNVVFDASFNYKIQENTSLDLNVSNLFDKKYVAYGGFGADFYNPGRSFAVTLRRTW